MTDSPAPPARSRRLYVLWGVSLTLLISTGLFCWLVVVPVWKVRQIAEGVTLENSSEIAEGEELRKREQAVALLGGTGPAAERLRSYILLPDFAAAYKTEAASILPICGLDAKGAVVSILGSGSYEEQWVVVYALERTSRSIPVPRSCSRLLEDAEVLNALGKSIGRWPDTGLSQYGLVTLGRHAGKGNKAAADALKKIKAKQEEQKR